MPPVSLRAHFDGTAIRLDEPFELPLNAPLLVTVLTSPDEAERSEWKNLSVAALTRAYGDNEPDYGDADLIP